MLRLHYEMNALRARGKQLREAKYWTLKHLRSLTQSCLEKLMINNRNPIVYRNIDHSYGFNF